MATLKELKDQILLAIYNLHKSGGSVSIMAKALCEANKIVYNSRNELETALRSLVNSNYIKVAFATGSNVGLITDITPEGVEYVEDYLLSKDEHIIDALKDTDRLMKSGAVIDDGSETNAVPVTDASQSEANQPSDDDIQPLYKATANYKNIADLETEACFGVNALADCFIKQMDKIASHGNENFCMLGIFGPWGRGKTYFFNKIKEKLSGRKDNIKYKTVEFNAWKYQDTPAIWAYLYEKLYDQMCCGKKVLLFIIQHLPSLIKHILIFLFVILLAWILSVLICKSFFEGIDINNILQKAKLPTVWGSVIIATIYNFIKNPIPAYKYIIKHSQRKSYKSYLGIQNDLENDLEVLLRTMIWCPKKKQLLLYVDDIDRCSTDKMLEVINSLRIILENTEIQKRLIVICSIDPDKLISGYCYQKAKGSNKKDYIEEAREHIDKLFIFGVGLAPLDISQYQEYLQTIAGIKNTTSTNDDNTPPYSEEKQNESFIVTYGTGEISILTDAEICHYMISFIQRHKNLEFTPRKLRIMYYRLLFANNLIAKGGGNMPTSVMDKILTKSIDPDTKIDNTTAYADIVNTVVPY